MEKYYWLILGTILGLSIAVYFFVSREERREETIDIEDLNKGKSSFSKFILECDLLAARW